MLRIKDFGKRDILVWQFELEREDVLNLKPLYEMLWRWLTEEGYTDYKTGSSDKYFEHLYWERILIDGKKEHHVWWRMAKEINDYIRYVVKLDFQTLNMSKAEIAYQGKKTIVDKGDIIIRVWFFVQWDWKDKIQKSFVRRWGSVLKEHIYRKEMEQHYKNLVDWGYKMHSLIKDYFESETGKERLPGWVPHRGYIE